MGVPATLEIRTQTRADESSRAEGGTYFSEYATPSLTVPKIARFIDWCQIRNEMPTCKTYDTYSTDNPGDLFNADDQALPVVTGELAFTYQLGVMTVPGGWIGSLKISRRTLSRRSTAMRPLIGVSFRSDDLIGLHNCALHYLNRSIADVKNLNRPSLTYAGEQELREQALWHRARIHTARTEVA